MATTTYPTPTRHSMHCTRGEELHQLYEQAEKDKIAVNLRRSPNSESPVASAKEFHAVKQRYLEHFADWLSHKAFCQDCKPKS